ncbi:T9SS type B sorting domain-containing protein [Flavobacterium aquicola]|uniref:T9SS type B sorting domain-containing protein n=1 Tax=Flavobacterium aquicola TaxID=1682742 RepID=UPI003742CBDD
MRRYCLSGRPAFQQFKCCNGAFNVKELFADDYWYTITFEDGREAKGHFSIKR